MKQTFAIIGLILTFSVSAFAQRTVVTGAVKDSLTNEGEVSAILQFYKAGTEKAIAFTTTDVDGNFAQALTGEGEYKVVFSNMGRMDAYKSFILSGQDTLDIGVILARDDVRTLKSSKVTAQRVLVKMDVDKMTYNVEEDVDSKTSTVLDMLRKVPMVTVDGQDNISVNGSSSFQVTVDGKPSQMFSSNPSQIFKMMPASAVKNIEVITNPGVKYDAEGVGGVLNITTNREATGGASVADGLYGTIRGMASTRGGGGGVFVSEQKGKLSWSLNGNAMYNKMGGTGNDVERIQITPEGNLTTSTHSESEMTMPMAMGNLSASYEISGNDLVSATAGLMHFGSTNIGSSTTSMPLGSYVLDLNTGSTQSNITGSIDYQHNWAEAPGRMITFSYQFAGSPSVSNSTNLFGGSTIAGLDLTNRKTEGKTGSTDNTFQIDFTTPLGKASTLSTGVKFLNRHNSSDENYYLWNGSDWTFNEAGSIDYDFFNRIGAIYTEFSSTLGSISLKGGVRYEHTWQEIEYSTVGGHNFSTDYGVLVPTASIQYNLSQTQNIGLSYNLRISRPGISYLNPYVDRTDPTSLSYGNTGLDVEKGHNINLVYNMFTPKFMLNLTLRETLSPSGISQYSFFDADNLLNSTFGNIVKSSVTGLNLFANWSATSKTRIYVNGGANYSVFSSEILDQSNSGLSYNVMLGLQQTLPGDFRLSANLINTGKTYSLQGWNTGISLATLGVTKSFLDDKLSFSLMGTLPLTGKTLEMKSCTSGKDFINNMTNTIPMSQISLNISWSFGKQSRGGVKSTRRTIENDDVLNSTSTAESLSGTMMSGGGM